jgi:hypothetical protein
MNTNLISIAAWALGVIGISGITATLRHSRRLSRQYRFLRLQPSDDQIDIVLPTSDRVEGGVGIRYRRSTTSVGNLKGATEIAQVVGNVVRRRPVAVAVSEELESPLSGDLVLIGLPAKNAASRVVIEHLKRQHPEIGFALHEADGCRISLAGFSAEYDAACQDGSDIPTRDFALILLWVNPTGVRKRRLLLCAGFTGYGTAAAAKYILADVIDSRYRQLRKEAKGRLPRLYVSREWPCFAMIIEAILVSDQVVDIRERAFVALPDPGCPPWPERSNSTLISDAG